MDKVTLTKEQLKELKKFINSRGFREPLIVMEILDHFACLVEEKLQENPAMPLAEAMRQAHGSFGVMGFKAIADAADMERNKRLNRQFNKTLHNMMQSPVICLLLVLAGALYYSLYIWLHDIFPVANATAAITTFPALAIFVIGHFIILRRFPGIKNKYVSGKGTMADNGYTWLAFIFMMFFPHYPGGDWPLMPFAIAATVYILAILVYIIAMYRTWQATEQYYSDIEQLHTELDIQ